MFNTPSKRTGARPHNTPKKVPLRGLFMDGIWHCNCNPRQPASHFEVKKDGSNKGKWFYTCQKQKDNGGCGFFLWDSHAAPREMRAVINNTRSEPESARKPTPNVATPSRRDTSGDWIQNLGKKNVVTVDEDDDEFGEWPLTQEEEATAVHVAESPVPPETPRKSLKASPFMTPGSKRKREGEYLPTPATGKSDSVFGSPSKARRNGGMWDGNEPFGLRSPSKTPIPIRFHNTTESLDGQAETKQSHDLVEEVMDLLKDQKLEPKVAANLRELLTKHSLKHSGILKGRHITRLALTAKDNKIADLQQRITALETQCVMDKSIIKHFKDEMANSFGTKGGPSRPGS